MRRLEISIEEWDELTGETLCAEMSDTVYQFTEGQTIRQIAGSNYNEQRRIYHLDRVARARIRRCLMDEAAKIGVESESEIGAGICHSCSEVVCELNNDPLEAAPIETRVYGGFKICNSCLAEVTQAPN